MKKIPLIFILFLVITCYLSPGYACKRILEDQNTEIFVKKLKTNLASVKVNRIEAGISTQCNHNYKDLDLTIKKNNQVNKINLSSNLEVSILNYFSQDTLLRLRSLSKSFYQVIRNVWKNQILNLSNQFLIVPFPFKNTTGLFLSDN